MNARLSPVPVAGVVTWKPRAALSSITNSDVDRMMDHLAENGVLMIGTGSGALSTPMTEKEIDFLGEAVLAGLKKIKHCAAVEAI